MNKISFSTANHWCTYWAEVEDGKVIGMRPAEAVPDPLPRGHGIVYALDATSRIRAAAVRKGWLENGPGSNIHLRGQDAFVEVNLQAVEELVAIEVRRVRDDHGSTANYGRSYRWVSAGRFRHAQSQFKRLLNCCGGFTSSVFTYLIAAAILAFEQAGERIS